jgi:sigma-B regulation protein RsbU (phosphoserine phosphatase)
MRVDAEHLGIIVADVSGKGISGAIVMAICRSILRTHAAGNLSPAAVLKAANAAIARDLPESMFISVLYMLFNTRTLELRVARAGHLRPVICRADRITAVTVDSEGMAMGISNPQSFDKAIEETSVSLGRGDTVVAYTDGITEALDADRIEWTDESLVNTVQATLQRGGNGRDIADSVQKALLEFVGGTPQSDDMTLVVLQVA